MRQRRGDNTDTNSDRDISLKTEQNTGIVRIDWTANDFDIVSITGYESSSKDGFSDSDSTNVIPGRGTEVHPDSRQLSQEVRISGGSDDLSWLAGVYYIDYRINGSQSRCNSMAGGCPTLSPPVIYSLNTNSWAIFGNLDYQFNDELSLTLGVSSYSGRQRL